MIKTSFTAVLMLLSAHALADNKTTLTSYSIACLNQTAVVNGQFVPVKKVTLSSNTHYSILNINGVQNTLPPLQVANNRPSSLHTGQVNQDDTVIRVGIGRGALPALSVSLTDKAGNSLWEFIGVGCRDHATID